MIRPVRDISLICFFFAITFSGCVVHYPVVGAFKDYNEVLKGQVNHDLTTGSAYIEVEGLVTKMQCAGSSRVTYIPPVSIGCQGQRGQAELTCDDGRVIEATYITKSCTKGTGLGFDQYGNKFAFVFGMNDAEAMEYINRELQVASSKPALPVYRPKEIRAEKGFSTGTGFFVSDDGLLITSYHVIEDSEEIVAVSSTGEILPATVVRVDPTNDIALLWVDFISKPLSVPLVPNLLKGEEVFTLGYPLVTIQGQEQKATFGRINSLSGVYNDVRFVQTDVPIQPGNSGGPLINRRGEVVGIVTATLDQLETLRESGVLPQNVNYAVKSAYLIPLLSDLVDLGIPKHDDTQRSVEVPILVENTEPSIVLIVAR